MPAPIEVSCADVHARRTESSEFLLLDCREEDEYETVRIEGATLIPMSELQERIGELEEHRQRDIVVYCHHGGRSLRVAMWLRGQGFPGAVSMAGGVDQWAQEIEPGLPRY